MIKFFRHIRQNLLNEGKTTKYFKYAIGEIILVVIGILIALSINNWNDQRKQNTKEIAYLKNLREDVASQIITFNLNLKIESIIIRDVDDILQHIKSNGGFKNLDSINSKINDLTIRYTLRINNTTFQELNNTGQINIFRNPNLKKEIVAFYQITERASDNIQNNNTNLIDNLMIPDIMNLTAFSSAAYSDELLILVSELGLQPFENDMVKTTAENLLAKPENQLKLLNRIKYRSILANYSKKRVALLKEMASQLLYSLDVELEKKQ
ncbi:DUF6090 family protein [Aequorivita sp. CIP111184]|uniref:DUF6090 family protein n=1 Tax=Aequorivita sp. CIP111184 TaxID=2211356 RepID=UPI000DBC292D|nr:DUF6090 family protein [Aequorivita sp. CIP111184]SRX54417.1 hypothetical protein AEQU1_01427 [Aequorivita sp. CIP111184]